MDPARKRTVRLVVALGAAVLLAGALVYTSFSASSEARTPSQLATGAQPGKSYQLTGKVVAGYDREGTVTNSTQGVSCADPARKPSSSRSPSHEASAGL